MTRKFEHRPSVGMTNTMFLSVEIAAGKTGQSFESMCRQLIREALAARFDLHAPGQVSRDSSEPASSAQSVGHAP